MAQESILIDLRNRVGLLKGRRQEIRRSLAEARSSVRHLSDEIDLLSQVNEFLRTLIDLEITEGVRSLESLQTEGVKAVFQDQDITVRGEIEVSRGKVNVNLVTKQQKENGDVIEGSSLDGFGGAVSTVQSILLRLALIFRRGLRPVLFLDETLPAFDDRYVHNMATFLKVLCQRLGVDILLVTHNQALVDAADHAYVLRVDRGHTVVRKVHS